MKIVGFIFLLMFVASCGNSTKAENSKETKKMIGMPNPASVKCHEDGHKLEIRKDSEGNEYGVCISAQGKECDEWAYFRGECKLSKSVR